MSSELCLSLTNDEKTPTPFKTKKKLGTSFNLKWLNPTKPL